MIESLLTAPLIVNADADPVPVKAKKPTFTTNLHAIYAVPCVTQLAVK